MLTDPVCQGFLADIIEHPADDVPRLIFADWLQDPERDDPTLDAWGQFIRDQIELEAYRDGDGRVRCEGRVFCEGSDWTKGRRRRCRPCELVASTEQTLYGWCVTGEPVPFYFASRKELVVSWSRGFIDSASAATIDDWRGCGPPLASTHPVEKVRVRGREPLGTSERGCMERGVSFYSWFNLSLYPLQRVESVNADDLPGDVWELLDGEVTPALSGLGTGFKTYTSEKDANAALSRALLKLARGG